jgi:GntR family transcriptional regulator
MVDPMYRQIAKELQERIESGELAPGTRLPTEIEMREQYDASRNTVRDAMKVLITRGLIETHAGHGTFVVDNRIAPFITVLDDRTSFGDSVHYASEVAAHSRVAATSAPRVEIHQATGVVASGLKLPEGALVVSRHQQRYIDGTPWSLQTTFYPMQYVDDGARRLIEAIDMPRGVVRYLKETLGIEQVGWRDMITVRVPDANESAFFRLPENRRVAVFEIQRTGFEESGAPLRLTITTYPTDRNCFVRYFGKIPIEMAPSEPESG